ncbi:MAG: hypothetical protein ABIT08_09840 [Bacteroidia bacterium]
MGLSPVNSAVRKAFSGQFGATVVAAITNSVAANHTSVTAIINGVAAVPVSVAAKQVDTR